MLFLSLPLEVTAYVIVIVLFLLSITIHLIPMNFLWVIKKKGNPYRVLKPGLHFVFPFIYRIIKKVSTEEQKGEIYLSDVITKDGFIECFKIDYSYLINNYDRYSYEFDLSDCIINSLRIYVDSIEKENLQNINLVSDKIYSHIKEVIEANGYSLTKITIYHEK